METTISTKLKLLLTSEQKTYLNEFCFAYKDALNYVSKVSFENGKIKNSAKLHKLCYPKLREKFNLPSQIACSVSRQVASSYKTLRTTLSKSKKKKKSKKFTGLDSAPQYVSRTATLQYKKDFGFKSEQTISIMTLNGRIICKYEGYNKHLQMIKSSNVKIGAAKLWYCKRKKQYYLIVSLTLSKDIDISSLSNIIGVDIGYRNLAVTTTPNNNTQFFSGKKANYISNKYCKTRKSLQQKGTRSAKRRLVMLSDRERRFKAAINHNISAVIAQPNSLIGIENLTNITRNIITKRKVGKKASKKQRKANHKLSKWAFAELQSMIAYKAQLNNGLTIKIDAEYTSQQCPKCGFTSKDNRPNGSLMFRCKCCGYTLHSDLIGAKNLVMRTLLIRQECINTGALSTLLDVTNDEAKAARLQHYAELRWSSVTSPKGSLTNDFRVTNE